MTSIILTSLVAIVLALAMQLPVARVCRKNPAIAQWKPLLIAMSIGWGLFFAVRVIIFAENEAIRTDAIHHEAVAQEVASFLRGGDLQSALRFFGVGNEGFEFCVGIIYAITRAPQVVLIGFFTFMAFCGLLTLLDVLARSTQATRIPFWLVCLIGLYPEALFWATDLWKEGLVIWGMCTMLRFIVPDPTKRGSRRWVAPILGTLVFAFLRPHIAFAWLVAIAIAQIVKQRRWGLGLVAVAGVCGSFLMMMVLVAHD